MPLHVGQKVRVAKDPGKASSLSLYGEVKAIEGDLVRVEVTILLAKRKQRRELRWYKATDVFGGAE